MKLDYKSIGFKAGLEVHHQLDTKRKLFCHCPVVLTNKPHDTEILRHMRPTLSELGEYDGTALMEFKTKKNVTYRIFRDLNCTYEMDDTPPFLVNEQAVDISIAVAQTFEMSLVDELHITRKQYLDGSIPAGFQRTAIIGVGGEFFMDDKRIGILHMSLEEDSCREVSDTGHDIVFKADRLGFPLIEVVTDADFKTPDEAATGAEVIRRALWNLNRVRRGPGSARHDVNCSITGGTRIEIKGVSKISEIPLLLHNEAMRQKALLEIKDILKSRGITHASLTRSTKDVTRLMKHADNSVVDDHNDLKAIAVKLTGFGDLLAKPTQEHTVFADEFAGRIRVIACLDRMPNILFPESNDSTGINTGLWRKIRKRLGATHDDAIIVVFGTDEDLETAVTEIYTRACEATEGVPSETRQALDNGSNDFERILPGPDRMYPDTDHPPVPLLDDRVNRIKAGVPEQPWYRERRYRKLNLPEDIVKNLSISSLAPVFDRLSEKYPDNLLLLSEIFGRMIKGLKRRGYKTENISETGLKGMIKLWKSGKFFREGFMPVLRCLSENPDFTCENAILELGMEPADKTTVLKVIEDSHKLTGERSFPSEQAKHTWMMGCAMRKLIGRVSGKEIAGLVSNQLS